MKFDLNYICNFNDKVKEEGNLPSVTVMGTFETPFEFQTWQMTRWNVCGSVSGVRKTWRSLWKSGGWKKSRLI